MTETLKDEPKISAGAGRTDFEIIKACLDGDKNCFSEIVSRYKNLVYSIILRMTADRDEANDLAQDVFVKIYRNLDKYYPEYKFSTWVMRITTNHIIDFRRKKKQEFAPLDEVGYDMPSRDDDESPEGAYMKKEKTKTLAKIINDLPDMYKIPIVLYHQQGLSYQEIADVTEEPLSKVKNRIFRGRKMLKEALTGVDY